MTNNRTIRIALGIAAGVVVLLAALAGGALRPEDATNVASTDAQVTSAASTATDEVLSEVATNDTEADTAANTEADAAAPITDEPADAAAEAGDEAEDPDWDDATSTDDADTSSTGTDDTNADTETSDDEASGDTAEADESDDAPGDAASDSAASDSTAPTPAPTAAPAPTAVPAPTAAPAPAEVKSLVVEPPASPATAGDPACSLDRLVIYAGAQRSGVGQALRAALPQLGFGSGCSQPVTVLAANCPLQFSGALGAGAPYDPAKPYVAASSAVDQAALLAVLNTVSDTGTVINTLDFGYAQGDKPGEKWVAVFIPPSFDGWQRLASAAGVSPTAQSLCTTSGRIG